MKASRVRPITELKNRTKQLVHEVATSGRAVVITQKGKPQTVLMDVASYDRLQDTLAMLKLLAQSQASLSRGRAHTTAEVKAAAHAAIQRARHDA